MLRRAASVLAVAAAMAPALMSAQQAGRAGRGPAPSIAAKIADAMSAAPQSISKNATIMDWPDSPAGQPKPLRAGTNGWVCYPSDASPAQGSPDPMCLDKQWQAWAEAYMSKMPPKVAGPGLAYMLKGDRGASNVDPFATAATPANQWVVSPAHMMVLFGDPRQLDAFPADPQNGGPWVMWKGTPYAHLMVPVSPTRGAQVAK